MEKADEKWDQEGLEDDVEEEKEEEGLRNRNHSHKSTTGNSHTIISNSTVPSNGNGDDDVMNSSTPLNGAGDLSLLRQVVAEEFEVGENASEYVINGVDEKTEAAEKVEDLDSRVKSVYYENHEADGYTNGLSLTEKISITSSAPEGNPSDNRLHTAMHSSYSEFSFSPISNHQYERSLKHDGLSGSTLLPSEILPDEDDTSYKSISNKAVETADINLIRESDHGVTEFDVERVLEKQDTHDLYCPNCNSCITRRVIVRKRKRKIRTSGEDVKRNKLETKIGSELEAVFAVATSGPASNAVDICLDGNVPPVLNDYDQERQPDVFRCLSCFSFFIPTGNGFKLFRMFSDKSEKEITQDLQQTPVVKKSWFSSIFASGKGELLMDQGIGHRADVKTNIVEVNNQNGEALSIHVAPSPQRNEELAKGSIAGLQDGGDGISLPSAKRPADLGNLIVDVGEKSDDAIYKSKGNDFKLFSMFSDKSEKETTQDPQQTPIAKKSWFSSIFASGKGELLMDQGIGNRADVKINNVEVNDLNGEALSIHGAPSPQRNEELVKGGITGLQDGGDNISLSSAKRHTKLGNPIVDFGEKSDDAIYKSTDEEAILLLPTPVSMLEESYTDSKGDISTNISSHNEQKVPAVLLSESVTETENGIVKMNDKGKDTIIDVESSQVEPVAAQRAKYITVSTEPIDSPHIETQILVVEQRSDSIEGVQGVDIIKSIVYGGLIESITSVGVVSSAAGADAATLNVLALGLANLIGGLILIGHDLWELKSDRTRWVSNQFVEQVDRYQELLGQRRDFLLHAIVAVVSFLVFGLIPPVTYGFSFRKSNDRNLKLVAVAGASLLCIVVLAAGKAYAKRQPKSYIKTVVYYIAMGLIASGVSYAIGSLIKKFLEKLSLFRSSYVTTLPLPEAGPMKSAWASY